MVLDTKDPSVTAPRNSNIQPKTMACVRVKAPAPTEVPTLLAISLAPLATAKIKLPVMPTMKRVYSF